MARPLWFVSLLKRLFSGRYHMARLTKVPILGKIIDYLLFEGDDIIYLPKNRVIQVNIALSPLQETVLPSRVVEHFIMKSEYHWIMKACICRDASLCQHYPIDLGCLFLGEAVLKINPQLGSRVTKEAALEHVAHCREAGLIHLIGRNKLDTVWLGVGPGTKLLTICHCCPCCCLWRVVPYLDRSVSRKITKMPGVTVSVNEQCVGCGTCSEDICFVQAIRLSNNRAFIDENCRGCGRCVEICPQNAIQLALDEKQPVRTTIDRLAPLVDLE
ncbi:indolepyruvate ferredoxin oxidoreductase subunit alpha [candidate division CSSED10-310 bacterium]|uniref:Indolepyruvate ferredoxin oxidoreductase subunit alpha n=1 Tax=candidate division CSSED10-310 bacterium TaxID=2855610 RepID=A0ABV6YTG0_UNCC1